MYLDNLRRKLFLNLSKAQKEAWKRSHSSQKRNSFSSAKRKKRNPLNLNQDQWSWSGTAMAQKHLWHLLVMGEEVRGSEDHCERCGTSGFCWPLCTHSAVMVYLYWPHFLVVQLVKNPPAMWETWVLSLDWEDPLEKGKATHFSILAWRIPWRNSPWGAKSRTRLSHLHFHFLLYWLRQSLWLCRSQQTVENSRDGNTRPYLPPEKSLCRSRSNS